MFSSNLSHRWDGWNDVTPVGFPIQVRQIDNVFMIEYIERRLNQKGTIPTTGDVTLDTPETFDGGRFRVKGN